MAKRQTILVRCDGPDCFELVPASKGRCKRCRKLNPHKCTDCDTIIYGQAARCEPCRVKHKWQMDKKLQKQRREEEKAAEAAVRAKAKQREPQQSEEEINKRAMKIEREFTKAEKGLIARRDNLNQQLLAQRLLGRAVCNYVGG